MLKSYFFLIILSLILSVSAYPFDNLLEEDFKIYEIQANINQWIKSSDGKWLGQVYEFTITDTSIGLNDYILGLIPNIQKDVFITRENEMADDSSLYVEIYGLNTRPESLKFLQRVSGKKRFLKLENEDFTINNRNPYKITEGINKKDAFGYSHPVLQLYFKEDDLEKKKKDYDGTYEITYQVKATILGNNWNKIDDKTWLGQIFKYSLYIKMDSGEKIKYYLKGYYPDDKFEIFYDFGSPPQRTQSQYIIVHGFSKKPQTLKFVQPPINMPKFITLKTNHFSIAEKNPDIIVIEDKEQKDFLGYKHPTIHLYFENAIPEKKQIIKPDEKIKPDEIKPDEKIVEKSVEIIPEKASKKSQELITKESIISTKPIFKEEIRPYTIIILDATDYDRRAIAFNKSRQAVINYLEEIKWEQDPKTNKKLKIATAFEGHLKYLPTIKDIKREVPKVQAPSSLKEQLNQAFESFESDNEIAKKIVYIVSSRRADIITPNNINKLQLDKKKLIKDKKIFNCVVVGTYGGNSMKRLTDELHGKFFRCNNSKKLAEKISLILKDVKKNL